MAATPLIERHGLSSSCCPDDCRRNLPQRLEQALARADEPQCAALPRLGLMPPSGVREHLHRALVLHALHADQDLTETGLGPSRDKE